MERLLQAGLGMGMHVRLKKKEIKQCRLTEPLLVYFLGNFFMLSILCLVAFFFFIWTLKAIKSSIFHSCA